MPYFKETVFCIDVISIYDFLNMAKQLPYIYLPKEDVFITKLLLKRYVL